MFWFHRRPRVAVLGAAGTGKTALIRQWKATSARLRPVEGDGAMPSPGEWRDAARRARHTLYLIDARALCGCLGWTAARDITRVERDLPTLAGWLPPERPPVIVVTHVDLDCRVPLMLDEEKDEIDMPEYAGRVTDQLAPLLSDVGPVRVLAGSLSGPAAVPFAARVLAELSERRLRVPA